MVNSSRIDRVELRLAYQEEREEHYTGRGGLLVSLRFGKTSLSGGKDLAMAEMAALIGALTSEYEISTTFAGKPTQKGLFVNSIEEEISVSLKKIIY